MSDIGAGADACVGEVDSSQHAESDPHALSVNTSRNVDGEVAAWKRSSAGFVPLQEPFYSWAMLAGLY